MVSLLTHDAEQVDGLVLNLRAKILYVCEHMGKIGWIALSLAALLLGGAVILIDS